MVIFIFILMEIYKLSLNLAVHLLETNSKVIVLLKLGYFVEPEPSLSLNLMMFQSQQLFINVIQYSSFQHDVLYHQAKQINRIS